MARIIVLDSGPLSLACGRRGKPGVDRLNRWRGIARANGALIVIPEIADYEVRRELIRCGSTDSLSRLTELRRELRYLPISTAAVEKAAELWASARQQGFATADDTSLDADVILAAQAMLFGGLGDTLIVATSNPRHLARFLDSRPWEDIVP